MNHPVDWVIPELETAEAPSTIWWMHMRFVPRISAKRMNVSPLRIIRASVEERVR
jgi:hypothetical protein